MWTHDNLNKYDKRVVEYENGEFGIQTKFGLGNSWVDDIRRFNTEQEAKDAIASSTVKRVCR